MALMSFRPSTPTNATTNNNKNKKEKQKDNSWEHFKNLLSCKINTTSPSSQVHDPSSSSSSSSSSSASSKYVRLSSTCGSSICSFREVAHGNTRVVDHASSVSSDAGGGSGGRGRHQSSRKAAAGAGEKDSTPLTRSCGGGMQLRKLSGCYECRAVSAEPASRRYPRPRTLCPCTECREVFTKPESLEHHQALRHAVSELGPEDSGRNIVEIIFKSSWQKKDSPVCKIERILKVHTTQRAAARFEDYRDSVRTSRALLPRKNPRCAADGNELLRFHCTSLSCPLGANSSTSLCLSPSSSSSSSSNPQSCDVCTIIRYGFSRAPASAAGPQGIRTTASSGRVHDCGPKVDSGGGGARIRAMLVCRVIAGRVKTAGKDKEEVQEEGLFDSVAGEGMVGSYGNLEELFVANPRAILPCFVVIYRALD